MNRTQKKCLIASGAFHGSLVLLLVFGSALMPEDRPAPANRITFFDPSKVTDGPTQGGNPGPVAEQPPAPVAPPVAPPQPPPQPPTSQPVLPPQPQPRPQQQPAARQEDFKPAPVQKPDAESFKPVKPVKTTQTDEFTPVGHPPTKQVASNDAAADARAKALADKQQRIANQISRGVGRLSSTLNKDTAVQISSGGDGGEAAANYRDIVASIYHAAWNQPTSLNDDTATVVVSVTIGRDGRVLHHEITKPSGNPVMDHSIENTLDNVTDIAPFPEGSRDAERTYSITFNCLAK
jgi:TonB family protein